jgi:imidazolonepropionase-like amidohydrolase
VSIFTLIVALLIAASSPALAVQNAPLLGSPPSDADLFTKTAPISPLELGGSCEDLDPVRRPGLLIKNARLVDGTGAPVRERVSILIQEGKIAMVGQGLSLRSDRETSVLDASGMTVLPGLIFLQADFDGAAAGGAGQSPTATRARNEEQLRAYLAWGITTVLDDGSSPEVSQDVQGALANGSPGPRYLTRDKLPQAPAAAAAGGVVGVKLSSGAGGGAGGRLELTTGAGSSPLEAISAATKTPAEMLGIADQVGTITVGKRADLVIVQGDPTSDLGALRNVAWTVRDGVARTPVQWMQAGGFVAGAAPSNPNR